MKKLVAGMDLHSNNVVIGVMDVDGQRVASAKVPCDLKAAKTNQIIATKALACKLAKAAWYLAAEETDYEPGRMFPQLAGGAMKP
jgi:hypothetical protein